MKNFVSKKTRRWRHSPRLCLSRWAEKNVVLPANYASPGPFRTSRSRWMLKIFASLENFRKRETTLNKATQTGGSLISDIWIAWVVRVFPAPMQINMQTDPDARDHAITRINPLLENCAAVTPVLPDQRRKLTMEISMQFMFLKIQGANISSLQSKSICYQANDEMVFWHTAGLAKHADNRLPRFRWRRHQFNVSQAGLEGDEFDKKTLAGTQEEFSWPCPKCGHRQPFKWEYDHDHHAPGGMKYTEDDTTHPGGTEWDPDRLIETVYYECRQCRHRIRDTPAAREALDQAADWVVMNARAQKTKDSFHLPAMACLDISWGDLVVEFVHAVDALKTGDTEPMKNFIMKRLSESWKDNLQFFEARGAASRDYLILETTVLIPPTFWEPEDTRFLSVDTQLDHYWYISRAFSVEGASRLIAEGRLTTDEEIRDIQTSLKVRDDHVILDSGFRTIDVYMLCCIYGWRAMRGDDKRAFPWVEVDDKGNETRYYRPWSKPERHDPLFGYNTSQLSADQIRHFERRRKYRHAINCLWSNRVFNDLLQSLKNGKGAYWGVPSNVSQTYLDQLDGATLRKKRNKQTNKETWEWVKVGRKGDHIRDCELQALVAAAIDGRLIGRGHAPPPAEEKDVVTA